MLINAQREAEVRVAVVSENTLEALQVETAETGLHRGNIYRGIVVNVQPSLNAAFVEYGAERHAFLKADDIVPAAYHRQPAKGERGHPEKVLERGRSILVQITKDATGEKGAAATTNLSLAGRYLVLMPFDDARGVSRKVEDEQERRQLRDRVEGLDVPEGFGLIVRTNAEGQNKATLNRDLAALLRLWKRIKEEAGHGKGPRLLYSDQDLLVQALRDYLDASIEEVLVDSDLAFEKAQEYMRSFMPRAKTRLVRYAERMPLFSRFGLEPQIEAIFQRSVPLPNGGSIVIEATEALTTIDVNSGKGTRGANQEENAFAVNREAAREVARQLRLRDIGGLVVADFIDMRSQKHQREIEKTLREAMKVDRARFTVGKISPNGLLEVNRQRIKQALQLRTHRDCPTCKGTGIIASPEHVSLTLLRRIEAAAAGGSLAAVHITLHPELADAFQNHHRQEIAALEREFGIKVVVIAGTSLHRSEEKVEWFQREWSAAAEAAPVRAADVSAPGRQRRGRAPKVEPEIEAAEGEVPPPPTKESRKRRRRGGRKHRRGKAKGPAPEDLVLPEPEAVEPPMELAAADVFPVEGPPPAAPTGIEAVLDRAPAGSETAPDLSSTEEPARGKRRRRRRRPRRRGAAGAPTGAESEAMDAAEPEGAEGAPAPAFADDDDPIPF